MKSLMDRKVNRDIKDLNRKLEQDVFGRRFWARQYQKAQVDGIGYYLYELCDREQPERNYVIRHWMTGWEIYRFHKVWEEMNNFIVTSDFWAKYHKKDL